MNIDGNKISIPSDDSELVRVVCTNHECEAHRIIHEYDANYRQHTIALCGSCGGELHELIEDEQKAGNDFRRVRLHRPLLDEGAPRLHGLTKAEREAGWEIQPMVGKVAPLEENSG